MSTPTNLPDGVTANDIPSARSNYVTDDQINDVIEARDIEDFLCKIRPHAANEYFCDLAANGLQHLPARIREPLIEWYRKNRLEKRCDEERWERESGKVLQI